MVMNDVMGCTAGVATGSDHPDYLGHYIFNREYYKISLVAQLTLIYIIIS